MVWIMDDCKTGSRVPVTIKAFIHNQVKTVLVTTDGFIALSVVQVLCVIIISMSYAFDDCNEVVQYMIWVFQYLKLIKLIEIPNLSIVIFGNQPFSYSLPEFNIIGRINLTVCEMACDQVRI